MPCHILKGNFWDQPCLGTIPTLGIPNALAKAEIDKRETKRSEASKDITPESWFGE